MGLVYPIQMVAHTVVDVCGDRDGVVAGECAPSELGRILIKLGYLEKWFDF